MIDYIEANIEEIVCSLPHLLVILAGDFNQLSTNVIAERTGLSPLVHQPTRGANTLDQVLVSAPKYLKVHVYTSVVCSDHKAIIAYADPVGNAPAKTTFQRTYRKKTPTQNAVFLSNVTTVDFDNPDPSHDTQKEFDVFYSKALYLLNYYYPERTVAVSSRDPDYITPTIKAKLRRKNRLMRSGRVEEAGALSTQIAKEIAKRNKTRLSHVSSANGAKDIWQAVRELTGRGNQAHQVEGITAHSLNNHYATISTDSEYKASERKPNRTTEPGNYITEREIFNLLDKLRPTATGLDQLPAWYLRLAAPILCAPLTRLFNMSVATGVVPWQWKQASIRPVPKMSGPKAHADFRPISITPVLTRIMEKTVVRSFLYPAFLTPPAPLSLQDQYAFRPTGSTTAALISILHSITTLLNTNPYVIVIAIDFSKAFDTVRQSSLLQKLAQFDIPDRVFNWILDFFKGHSHCTVYNGQSSELSEITASIIQGSAIGPAMYVVEAADLKAATPGNSLCKYADDTYIIIPASNSHTRIYELEHIEAWASHNNLTLNRAKTREIIFQDKRSKRVATPLPPPLPGITRSTELKILGVTVTNGLSVAQHTQEVVRSCSQTLHALRVLRCHGMPTLALQGVFRAVVINKLCYSSSAWWGFTTAADRQRLNAFIRRCKRQGYCATDLELEHLIAEADETLFQKILRNPSHVLAPLLPGIVNTKYQFRHRKHNRQMIPKTSSIHSFNFIIRMLYKDSY